MGADATSGRLTRDELEESLLFYRRRLTERIVIAFIRNQQGMTLAERGTIVEVAEDMANAICERLAARETGNANGYRDVK